MAGKGNPGFDGRCAAERMLRGHRTFCQSAVRVTLGPKGRNGRPRQILWRTRASPRDGVTVAKEIELSDKFENMGAQMVREVASENERPCWRRHDDCHRPRPDDRARGRQGGPPAGMNPMDLKRGIRPGRSKRW